MNYMSKPTGYSTEAETFVRVMKELAPQLQLDYTRSSLFGIERFIVGHFDQPGSPAANQSLVAGVGCYLGEVIIRTIGGHWSADGAPEVRGLRSSALITPLRVAIRRFNYGREESLVWYYDTISLRTAKIAA